MKPQPCRKFISFEYIELLLTSVGKTLKMVIVYRPPPSTTNGLSTTIFFDEFSSFLEKYITIPGSLLMVGDFNFQVDTCDSEYATTFLHLLDVFNLNQHINGCTHKYVHILRHVQTLATTRNIVGPTLLSLVARS